MYVETDFALALIKEDDWLSDAAEKVYEENAEDLWTSRFTYIEVFIIAYRENWNCLEVVRNLEKLIEPETDIEDIKSAAAMIEEKNMTPFDALHLVSAEDSRIVSSDKSYGDHTERVRLEEMAEEEE